MGANTTLAARFAGVVRLVATKPVAEVASVYVTRPGEIRERVATEGLRAEAGRASETVAMLLTAVPPGAPTKRLG